MWWLIGLVSIVVAGIAYAAHYMTKEYDLFDDWENYD
jgi:hypothetical protein